VYESQPQRRHRERALELLSEAVETWVHLVSAGKGKGLDVEASLLTFGSYRLDVHSPDADIDCLLVAPGHCDRSYDFFVVFLHVLEQRSDVTELQPVPDAYTPVVKFRLNGIAIDLLFARLVVPSVPRRLVDVFGDRRDDPLLAKLEPSDEPSVRSLNGGGGSRHTLSFHRVASFFALHAFASGDRGSPPLLPALREPFTLPHACIRNVLLSQPGLTSY
jgi:poly(A) polymerase